MLSENQILSLPQPIVQYFRELESGIISRVCLRIGEISSISSTDFYRLENLRDIGFDLQKIQREVAATLNKTTDEIYSIFKNAAEIEYSSGENAYFDKTGNKFTPFGQNQQVQNLIINISEATDGLFRNISNTSVIGIQNASGKTYPLRISYREAVDYAALQVRLGQEDFYSAIRQTITSISNGGAKVIYESGNTRRLDSAARMNILGAQAELSKQQTELIGRQIGADGWEITYHSGHRPTHDFGGQQFTKDEFVRLGIGDLMAEPNCYHRKFPIIVGISEPAHSQEQLKQFEAKQNETHEFNGIKYDSYQATQRQRQYETAIRRKRDEANAYLNLADGYLKGGDKSDELYKQYRDTSTTAKAKAQSINQEYANFSNAMGLFTQPKRKSVPQRQTNL